MIVGTAGHVNHGKTTLVEALTGVHCDRLAVERARGMTIVLGFAPWTLPDGRRVSVIDVPGHARFARTMATGALAVELVVLVVAADEMWMPQTREHVAACQVLGIERAVVAVTRVDRVDDPETAIELVREELEETYLAGAAVVPVCAPRGEGLDALSAAVAAALPAGPHPDRERPAVLPIDRAFSVKGFGTVVTGSLLRGRLRAGEAVQRWPGGQTHRVRALHVHRDPVEEAQARCRLAVNLPDLSPRDLPRGAFLAAPDAMTAGRVFDAEIEWLGHHREALRSARSLGWVCGAARGQARLSADGAIDPGGRGTARLFLDREVPLVGGLRFVLRGDGDRDHGAVVGGGRVLDARPPRRRTAEVRRRLAAGASAAVLAEEAGRRGLDPATVAARLGTTALGGPTIFAPRVVAEAADAAVARVRAHHEARPDDPGLPTTELDLGAVGERAIDEAVRAGRLVREGATLRTPDHSSDRRQADARLAAEIEAALAEDGIEGPREHDLGARLAVPSADLGRVLQDLERRGRVVRVEGLCFGIAPLEALRRAAARAVLAEGPLPVSWLKQEAKVSRKHAMPLWTWLDRGGVTVRKGDVRLPGPAAKRWAADG